MMSMLEIRVVVWVCRSVVCCACKWKGEREVEDSRGRLRIQQGEMASSIGQLGMQTYLHIFDYCR